MKIPKQIAMLLTVTLITSIGVGNLGNVYATSGVISENLVGKGRWETAIEISKKGWSSAKEAIIINDNSIADALCATPFAHAKNSPILLTNKDTLDERTKKELKRLGVSKVYLIGGENVLSKNIKEELEKESLIVDRIFGETREETSLEIAKRLNSIKKLSEIAIVDGHKGLADGISIAAVASNKDMAIILSNPTEGTKVADEFIKSEDIKKSYIIGGSLVVPDNVKDKLPGAIRISGENRNETNAKVIEYFYNDTELKNAYVAKDGMKNQSELVDALAVGVLAAKNNSPVILVGNSINNMQKDIINTKKFNYITKVGGNGNEAAFNELENMQKITTYNVNTIEELNEALAKSDANDVININQKARSDINEEIIIKINKTITINLYGNYKKVIIINASNTNIVNKGTTASIIIENSNNIIIENDEGSKISNLETLSSSSNINIINKETITTIKNNASKVTINNKFGKIERPIKGTVKPVITGNQPANYGGNSGGSSGGSGSGGGNIQIPPAGDKVEVPEFTGLTYEIGGNQFTLYFSESNLNDKIDTYDVNSLIYKTGENIQYKLQGKYIKQNSGKGTYRIGDNTIDIYLTDEDIQGIENLTNFGNSLGGSDKIYSESVSEKYVSIMSTKPIKVNSKEEIQDNSKNSFFVESKIGNELNKTKLNFTYSSDLDGKLEYTVVKHGVDPSNNATWQDVTTSGDDINVNNVEATDDVYVRVKKLEETSIASHPIKALDSVNLQEDLSQEVVVTTEQELVDAINNGKLNIILRGNITLNQALTINNNQTVIIEENSVLYLNKSLQVIGTLNINSNSSLEFESFNDITSQSKGSLLLYEGANFKIGDKQYIGSETNDAAIKLSSYNKDNNKPVAGYFLNGSNELLLVVFDKAEVIKKDKNSLDISILVKAGDENSQPGELVIPNFDIIKPSSNNQNNQGTNYNGGRIIIEANGKLIKDNETIISKNDHNSIFNAQGGDLDNRRGILLSKNNDENLIVCVHGEVSMNKGFKEATIIPEYMESSSFYGNDLYPYIDIKFNPVGTEGNLVNLIGIETPKQAKYEIKYINIREKTWIEYNKVSGIDSIVGSDNYETSSLIASKQTGYENVILINEEATHEAITASGLSGVLNAPILMTKKDEIPESVKSIISNETVKKVYIIGGNSVISQKVEKQIRNLDKDIERISGEDRYNTSYKVAEKMANILGSNNIDKVILINGIYNGPYKNGYIDAMNICQVASKNKIPIILTKGEEIPSEILSILSNKTVYFIGAVNDTSQAIVNKTNASWLVGDDRQETNRRIIKEFYTDPSEFYIVHSNSQFNMLIGAPLAKTNPIVLVDNFGDKSILQGARKLTVLGEMTENLKQECIDAVNSDTK